MLYFKDINNNYHYLSDLAHLPEGGVLISWEELQELKNPKTLEQVKTEKIQEIEDKRNFQCVQNVTALNRTWQADGKSQSLLGHVITLAQAGLPLPLVWRDADNNNMSISALSDLLAIAGAIAVQTQNAYSNSWALKQEVTNATTIQEMRDIIA